MSDNIFKENVYSHNQEMWHRKGRVGEDNETALQVYSTMLLVEFVQRPFSILLNGNVIESKDVAIIRVENGKERQIGSTKGRYQLIQPVEYCRLFDSTVGKPVETLGFLGSKAEKMFLTWQLPAIDVHGDVVNLYGFLANGFDGKFGTKLYTTSVRVICNNTWNQAIGAEDTMENYSSKHVEKDFMKKLGLWMSYINKTSEENVAYLKGVFTKMEEKPLTIDDAYGFFAKVFPLPNEYSQYAPVEILKEREQDFSNDTKSANENRDLAMSLFSGAGIEITPTLWGGFNVVTEMENHHVESKKDTTYSILLGNRQTIMSNAFNIAKEMLVVL